MESFNKKEITKISGSIITSFVNLFYLEEVERLGIIKHTAKKNLKRTLEDLKQIEKDYFNKTEEIDDKNLGDKLVANNLVFIDEFLKFDFNDFTKLQEVFVAFTQDKKRLISISDKILVQNGAKK
jgi:hypothetical protein